MVTSCSALPHAVCPVVTSIPEAAEALGAVRSKLDARLRALRTRAVADWASWCAVGVTGQPRVLVVVDELAELTVRDTGDDKAAREAQRAAVARLCEIGRLGRAAGIHLLLATQRPDADAVPGQLKANLGATVAFRVRSRVNSQILIEDDRAAHLPRRPGRAIWAHERLEEVQAVQITPDEAAAALRLAAVAGSGDPVGAGPVTQHPQTT